MCADFAEMGFGTADISNERSRFECRGDACDELRDNVHGSACDDEVCFRGGIFGVFVNSVTQCFALCARGSVARMAGEAFTEAS